MVVITYLTDKHVTVLRSVCVQALMHVFEPMILYDRKKSRMAQGIREASLLLEA
jgi:hypothetical protein